MADKDNEELFPELDLKGNELKRKLALSLRCSEYRGRLSGKDPRVLAGAAALSIEETDGSICLTGEYLTEKYLISYPSYTVTDQAGTPAKLHLEALWLHYLDRANGQPLVGRWVNLSEIGGLFYQQAFQGYCGDELAEAWGDNLTGLEERCLATGGWPLAGPGDLNFEWRILPRLPICLCYRLPTGTKEAWATILFDASAKHYVAADVAAIAGKELSDRLKPTN